MEQENVQRGIFLLFNLLILASYERLFCPSNNENELHEYMQKEGYTNKGAMSTFRRPKSGFVDRSNNPADILVAYDMN